MPASAAGALFPTVESRTWTRQYDGLFRKYSQRFFGPGFPWHLFKAQAIAESGLKPDAISPAGAVGIMQIMPTTWEGDIKPRHTNFGALHQPRWNIAGGIWYDRWQWERWPGVSLFDRAALMLAGYNAGLGYIRTGYQMAQQTGADPVRWRDVVRMAPRVKRWRSRETVPYVDKIFNLMGWTPWM